jgi:hypothetical protein
LAHKLAKGQLHLLDADPHPAELAWQATMANLARIAGESVEEAADGR